MLARKYLSISTYTYMFLLMGNTTQRKTIKRGIIFIAVQFYSINASIKNYKKPYYMFCFYNYLYILQIYR